MPTVRTAPRRAAGCGRPAPRGAGRPTPRSTSPRPRPAGATALRPRGRRRTRRLNWWPLGLLAFAFLVVLAWQADASLPALVTAPARCTVPDSGITLSPEQATNARTIASVANARKLPQRALVIALATAQQESRLRNLPYGDRDSLGLFQQRPSQGWGTAAQVQDPAYAAGRFFDHLVQVPNWQTGRLTDVAQSVQRSGFPGLYQRWEPMATQLAAALDSRGAAALRCS